MVPFFLFLLYKLNYYNFIFLCHSFKNDPVIFHISLLLNNFPKNNHHWCCSSAVLYKTLDMTFLSSHCFPGILYYHVFIVFFSTWDIWSFSWIQGETWIRKFLTCSGRIKMIFLKILQTLKFFKCHDIPHQHVHVKSLFQ